MQQPAMEAAGDEAGDEVQQPAVEAAGDEVQQPAMEAAGGEVQQPAMEAAGDEVQQPAMGAAGMTDYQWVKQQRAELRRVRQQKVGAAAVD